jgi:hypothetical protein
MMTTFGLGFVWAAKGAAASADRKVRRFMYGQHNPQRKEHANPCVSMRKP